MMNRDDHLCDLVGTYNFDDNVITLRNKSNDGLCAFIVLGLYGIFSSQQMMMMMIVIMIAMMIVCVTVIIDTDCNNHDYDKL